MKTSMNAKVTIYAFKMGYVVNKKGEVHFKDRKRSLILDNNGYFTFTVRMKIGGGEKDLFRRVWVHRLQAYQKYGKEIFKKNIHVRHLNSNEKDNSYDNILLGTPKQNAMDMPVEARMSRAIYASSKLRKFTDDIVKKINEDRKNGMTYKKLGLKYGVGKGTLSYFFNNALYNTGK